MHSPAIIALALAAAPTFAVSPSDWVSKREDLDLLARDEPSSGALNFKFGKFIPGSDFKRENLDLLAREEPTGDTSGAFNFGQFLSGIDFKHEDLQDLLARDDAKGALALGQMIGHIKRELEEQLLARAVPEPRSHRTDRHRGSHHHVLSEAPRHGGTTAPSADPSVNAPLADPPVGAPSADPVSKRFMTRPHAIFNRRIMTRPRTIFYIRETGPIIRDSDELHPHPWNGAHLLPSESPHPRSLYELD